MPRMALVHMSLLALLVLSSAAAAGPDESRGPVELTVKRKAPGRKAVVDRVSGFGEVDGDDWRLELEDGLTFYGDVATRNRRGTRLTLTLATKSDDATHYVAEALDGDALALRDSLVKVKRRLRDGRLKWKVKLRYNAAASGKRSAATLTVSGAGGSGVLPTLLVDDGGRLRDNVLGMGVLPDGSVRLGIASDSAADAVLGRNDKKPVTVESEGASMVLLPHYDADGGLRGHTEIRGTDGAWAENVAANESGRTAVVGEWEGTLSFGAGHRDALALPPNPPSPPPGEFGSDGDQEYVGVLDPNGAPLWVRALRTEPGNNLNVESVAVARDGSVVVGGRIDGTVTFEGGQADVLATVDADHRYWQTFVARYTPDGEVAWVRGITGDSEVAAYSDSVAALADGGVVVVASFEDAIRGFAPSGDLEAGSQHDGDVVIARYTVDGTLADVCHIGSVREDQALSVASTPDGGYVVCGETYPSEEQTRNDTLRFCAGSTAAQHYLLPANTAVAWVARFNPNGVLRWVRFAAGTEWVTASQTCGLRDGGFAVVYDFTEDVRLSLWDEEAVVASAEPGADGDLLLVRYGPDADVEWSRRVVGSTDGYNVAARAISEGPDGSIHVGIQFQGTIVALPGSPGERSITSETPLPDPDSESERNDGLPERGESDVLLLRVAGDGGI